MEDKNKNSVNENQDLAGGSTESPRPAPVSFALDTKQLAAVVSLYTGRTVDGNGGAMFGVLGEVFIDERNDEYGTAKFQWLSSDEYNNIRAAIRAALSLRNLETKKWAHRIKTTVIIEAESDAGFEEALRHAVSCAREHVIGMSFSLPKADGCPRVECRTTKSRRKPFTSATGDNNATPPRSGVSQ